jgi:hypothetical protein
MWLLSFLGYGNSLERVNGLSTVFSVKKYRIFHRAKKASVRCLTFVDLLRKSGAPGKGKSNGKVEIKIFMSCSNMVFPNITFPVQLSTKKINNLVDFIDQICIQFTTLNLVLEIKGKNSFFVNLGIDNSGSSVRGKWKPM